MSTTDGGVNDEMADIIAAYQPEIDAAKAALSAARARLLDAIMSELPDANLQGFEDMAKVDEWTICVRVDGVDLALVVTAA